MQKANDYHKLKHISDEVSLDVIMAQMMDQDLILKSYPKTSVGLFNSSKVLVYGRVMQVIEFEKDTYMQGDVFSVISQGTANHLGVSYVVVQSTQSAQSLTKIREKIFLVATMIAMLIIIIAVVLGKIFLKPIKDKIEKVEEFVKDTTHELNTPITALMMSLSRLKDVKECNQKSIQNISISTKQLYDIYASLSYISFQTKEEDEMLRFDEVVDQSMEYFNELLNKKSLLVSLESKPCLLNIAPTKAKMLINNLLSNAIKYSHPNSKLMVEINEKYFRVCDEGIGIEKKKLENIFDRFSRGTSYAGGFGVGLSIVDGIVKEYKYTLKIESKVDQGTTITIRWI